MKSKREVEFGRAQAVVVGNPKNYRNQWRCFLAGVPVLLAGVFGGLLAAAQHVPPPPNFGPNVIIIDPSMSSATINATLTSLAALDVNSQFITNRYTVFFKPGTYSVQAPIGYYESIAGLGINPSAVTINGFITPNFGAVPENQNLTETFWRSMENMTFNVETDTTQNAPPNTLQWGVSQGTSLRRLSINGSLQLGDSGDGYSSGGFIADTKVTGVVSSSTQQQWFTRNSVLGGWSGSNWNMVFAGVEGAPFSNYPTNSFTVLPTTPVKREKPFLYVDEQGGYRVFVPLGESSSSGIDWRERRGHDYSIPISQFFIAQPSNTLDEINRALAEGKNLILTPGIYQLPGSIRVTRPDTIVLGLGYATLVPQTGTPAITVADVDGVQLAGLVIDAGPVNSPVLLQLGDPQRSRRSHQWDPSSLNDIFLRIGGATPGLATTSLEIDSDDVILDNIWAWRADHGNGVGWTDNVADHGLVVNGDFVTALGLAVEHYEQNQVLWNGEHGETIFYQSELPYDVPSQSAWMQGSANGYSSYAVSSWVKDHRAYGLGVYSFFDQGVDIVEDSAITVPDANDVSVTHAVSVFIAGSGAISHVVDDAGGSVGGSFGLSFLPSYPVTPCTIDCPPLPDAPKDLSAKVVSTNQVNLEWEPSRSPLVRYSVFRSNSPLFTASAANQIYSGLVDTRYADTSANPAQHYYYAVEALNDGGVSAPSNIADASTPSAGGQIAADVLDINTGGYATGGTPNWVEDEYSTGGQWAGYSGGTINTALVPNPAPQYVYQTNRYGTFNYDIPGFTPGSTYIVDLHFAETYWSSPGQRQFNVALNGKTVLTNFDIVGVAGGAWRAVVESFLAVADTNGFIHLAFTPGNADNPQINGIEIGTPCTTGCAAQPAAAAALKAKDISTNEIDLSWTASTTPGVTYVIFRSQLAGTAVGAPQIVASGVTGTAYADTSVNPASNYGYYVEAIDAASLSTASNAATASTPSAGAPITNTVIAINAGGGAAAEAAEGSQAAFEWLADEDFTGGTPTSTGSAINTSLLSNPAPQAVDQTNRYGAMTYTIPGFTPGGTYIVDLHFAETYWTAPGQRLFNVSINNKQVLNNYDVFASAGSEYTATDESFFTTADSTGTITINFSPGAADNPQINGIQIGTP
ncbi:MAG: malectin domain-containing carbohydrate-binding protein [Terracidiphilus sp.]